METFFDDHNLDFEIQTDIQTLLENVRCQNGNEQNQEQAFLALASLCSSTEAQNYFFDVGGVEEIIRIFCEGSCQISVCPSALFCLACAVKTNARSQNVVLNEKFLAIIHQILSKQQIGHKLAMAATFFLACCVSGNGTGQSLVSETYCLMDVLALFRAFITEKCQDLDHWANITQAISYCISNPQNEKNQHVCCSIVPIALKFIGTCCHPQINQHILSVIGFIVVNNVGNQNRFLTCGGAEVLMDLISRLRRSRKPRDKLFYDLLASTVSALDLAIAENETSVRKTVELGLVDHVFGILREANRDSLDCHVFLLVLTHIFELVDNPDRLLRECHGQDVLVQSMAESEDEEMFKAIKYIFILCNEDSEKETRSMLPFKADNDVSISLKKAKLCNKKPSLSQDLQRFLASSLQSHPNNHTHSSPEDDHKYQNPFHTGECYDLSFGHDFKDGIQMDKSNMNIQNLSNFDQAPVLDQNTWSLLMDLNQKADKASKEEFITPRPSSRGHLMNDIPPSHYNCHPLDRPETNFHPFFHSKTPLQRNLSNYLNDDIFTENKYACNTSQYIDNNQRLKTSKQCYQPSAPSTDGVRPNVLRNRLHQYRERHRCESVNGSGNILDDITLADLSHINQTFDHQPPQHSNPPFPQKATKTHVGDVTSMISRIHNMISLFLDNFSVGRKSAKQEQDGLPGDSMKQRKYHSDCPPNIPKTISHDTLMPSSNQENVSGIQSHQQMGQVFGVDQSSLDCDCRNISPHPAFEFNHRNPRSTLQTIEMTQPSQQEPPTKIRLAQATDDDDDDDDEDCDDDDCLTQLSMSTIPFCRDNDDLQKKSDKHSRLKNKSCRQIIKSLKSLVANEDWSTGSKSFNQRQSKESKCTDSGPKFCTKKLSALDSTEKGSENPTVLAKADSTSVRCHGENVQSNVRKGKAIPTIHLSNEILTHSYSCQGGNDRPTVCKRPLCSQRKSFCASEAQSPMTENARDHASHRTSLSPASSSQKHPNMTQTPLLPFSSHLQDEKSCPSCHHSTSCQSFVPPPPSPWVSRTVKTPSFSGARKKENVKDSVSKVTGHGIVNEFVEANGNSCQKSPPEQTIQKERENRMKRLHATGDLNDHYEESHQEDRGEHHLSANDVQNNNKCLIYDNVQLNNGNSYSKDTHIEKRHSPSKDNQKAGSSRLISMSVVDMTPKQDDVERFGQNTETNDLALPSSTFVADKIQCRSPSQKGCSYCLTPERDVHTGGTQQRPAHLATVGPSVSKRLRKQVQSSSCTPDKRRSQRGNLEVCNVKSVGPEVDGSVSDTDDKFKVYEFKSEDDENKKEQLPSEFERSISILDRRCRSDIKNRRERMPYSDQEILNLRHGVASMGTRWQQILCTYQFHPCRRAVDLKEKFQRLVGTKMSHPKTGHSSLPFSRCEIQRLTRGVRMFGHNWKAILAGEKFLPGRTAEDLRSKWRTLVKK